MNWPGNRTVVACLLTAALKAPHGIWWAIEWLLWGFTAWMFVVFVWGMRKDARRGQRVHIVEVTQTLLLFVLAVVFLFIERSKLHLLWLLPAAFLTGYLDFIVLRIPLVGTILRMIIVSSGWLFLAGTDGVILGVPHGK